MNFLVKIIAVVVVIIGRNVESAIRIPRLSLAENMPSSFFYNNNIQGNSGAYSFNYDISDVPTGNQQYRNEDRYPNGTVTGAYGYVDAYGTPQRFRYIADKAGYRVFKDYFKPIYQTTMKPIDKFVSAAIEPEVTWTRPKRPNKTGNFNKYGMTKPNYSKRPNDLIGPPSLYVPYFRKVF